MYRNRTASAFVSKVPRSVPAGWLLSLLLAALVAGPASSLAQLLGEPPPRTELPADVETRLRIVLYEAELAAAREGVTMAQLQQDLGRRGLEVRDDGKVHVEIVGPQGAKAIKAAQIAPFGGEVTNTWRHRIDAYLPIKQLSAVARTLPAGYWIERADPGGLDAVGGEGATAINSDSYRDGGANGSGLTIAVIDSGFINLTLARNAGDAPPAGSTTELNYTGSGFQSGTAHGTGCTESAYDHCPGATWRLYKTDSVTDLGTAVNDCIAHGVDIITHSMSRYNLGWADNSGDACAAANNAVDNGILFFTSAGNRAETHWQGNYNAGLGSDYWHDWATGDEALNIVVDTGVKGNFYLSWDTTGGTYNYDLYLYDDDLTTVLASSTNSGNTYEDFYWVSPFGANHTVYLAVKRQSGGTTELEVFWHASPDSFQYAMAANSTTSPSNSTRSNVISNGAVTWASHSSPNGTAGIIKDYSSQGPSNSGRTLPDLAGPTDTTTTSYGGSFGGTSGATPNNAGAACAFLSADTQLSASAIRWLLYEQADLWKDWGTAGNDNIYGRGGTILTDYRANTIWIARSYGNTSDLRSAPFYRVQPAYDAAVSGGRLLIFPGGSYPETVNMTGTKSLAVETVENSAYLGS